MPPQRVQRRETKRRRGFPFFRLLQRFLHVSRTHISLASPVHEPTWPHLCRTWPPTRPHLTSPTSRPQAFWPATNRPPSPATMMCAHTHMDTKAYQYKPPHGLVCVCDARFTSNSSACSSETPHPHPPTRTHTSTLSGFISSHLLLVHLSSHPHTDSTHRRLITLTTRPSCSCRHSSRRHMHTRTPLIHLWLSFPHFSYTSRVCVPQAFRVAPRDHRGD